MKFWKTLALGALLAGATVMPSFAFDINADALEWTSDPAYCVTMYLGMPRSEFESNFTESNGWIYRRAKRFPYEGALGHSDWVTFTRTDPTTLDKNIDQREVAYTRYHFYDTDGIAWSYCAEFKYLNKTKIGLDVRNKANAQLYSTYLNVVNQLIEKLGKPTSQYHEPKTFDSYPVYAHTEWNIGRSERYYVSCEITKPDSKFKKGDTTNAMEPGLENYMSPIIGEVVFGHDNYRL